MRFLNPTSTENPASPVAARISLSGCVQGLGVRPAVVRLATSLDLSGSVRNTLAGLEIEVAGAPHQITTFQKRLPTSLPDGAAARQIEVVAIAPSHQSGFVIERDDATGPLVTQVPRDVAVCNDCLAEVHDPGDRRHLYALTTCSTCGPRFSLIERMPFERSDTTMGPFTLCVDCQADDTSSTDRRFHAQTVACKECGPQVWLADVAGQRLETGLAAVQSAARWLLAGKIVALRGVGGYQLLCDATSPRAVDRLRERKARPAKPFAVLVASLEAARHHAVINAREAAALTDRSNPIVLLQTLSLNSETRSSRRRQAAEIHALASVATSSGTEPRSSDIAASVHPHLNKLGLMLPSTPLHAMLCEEMGKPIVCTSANREGEPLEYDVRAAHANLTGIADLWLHHDRPIARPIDDSVVQVVAGRCMTLRLGRGMAPLPLALPAAKPRVAFGGHMKSAIAWHNGSQAVLGPHIGDLDTVATRERFAAHVADMQSLYRFKPESGVHDLHPDYFTTRYGNDCGAMNSGLQHHFAHVAAGMLEHDLLNREVLGVSWDGTGLGDDGTMWGGEFLVVEGATQFQRVAHLRAFSCLGGEAAIRQPWRLAVSLLSQSFSNKQWLQDAVSVWEDQPVASLLQMQSARINSISSTSVGRLFDGVAAIIFGLDLISYEGQAAMMLESVASSKEPASYPLPFNEGRLDWRAMIRKIWQERLAGVSPAVISTRFHRALASGIVAVAAQYPELPIVLAGGVFQNKLLVELVVEMLDDRDRLKAPGRIPPNDGGLAAGQLAIAVMRERTRYHEVQ